TRDIARAAALAGVLGLLAPDAPVLTVVGSKGKGTAATYASAFLAAAGLRVCTVTSPALRSNRERIRVDGRAVAEAELASLADALDEAVAALPPPSGGYLSPSGLFTLAGVLHARRTGADAIVLEAGMGGRSDEAALFTPDVAAITPVLLAHAGVLGGTPAEVAAEKRGGAGPDTVGRSAAPAPDVAEPRPGARPARPRGGRTRRVRARPRGRAARVGHDRPRRGLPPRPQGPRRGRRRAGRAARAVRAAAAAAPALHPRAAPRLGRRRRR